MSEYVLFLIVFAVGVLITANVIPSRYEIALWRAVESALWIVVIALSLWIGFHYDPPHRHASMAPDYKAYIDYRNEYKQQNNPQYRYRYVGDNMYEKVRVNY